MAHRYWASWTFMACILLATGVTHPAKNGAKQTTFTKALLESPVGTDPAQAYFLVDLLKATGSPESDVDALRRELLHAYAEQLAGATSMPTGNVAAAIARGRDRIDLQDVRFTDRWQASYNKALEIRWVDGDATTPYFATVYRGMRPVAPGLWAEASSNGRMHFMLGLRLFNTTKMPIPIHDPDLVWGTEPHGGHGGLDFTCRWDKPAAQEGSFKRDQVQLLQPGGTSDAIVCTASPAGAYWKEKLLAARGASQSGGLLPFLISHDFDNVSRQHFLELALSELAPQSKIWRLRLQLAQQEVGRLWQPAQRALDAPVAQKWTISPHAGWSEAGKKLKWFLAATLVSLALFAIGRSLLRAGVPAIGVTIGSMLGGVGLMFLGMRGSGGGTGYSSPVYVGIALYSAVIGPMLLSVLALHGLQRVLDDEDVSWWHTVVRGWSRLLDLSSPTSRADFWGFLAHCVWWWAMVHICVQPLDLWLGAPLLLAMLTLVVRRFRSLNATEMLALLLTVAGLVLLALLDR